MKIEKRSYSRNPWRLVTSDGREVAAPRSFDHPDIGITVINESISGETKTECTDRALALLEMLLTIRKEPK